jgi:hypothetical protein
MKLNIPIGQKLWIGPKAFKQKSKTKTNHIVNNLHVIILEGKPIGLEPKKKV